MSTEQEAVEAAVDRLLAAPGGAADPWAALVDALEALVIEAAAASGRFALMVGWDGQQAVPRAARLEWTGSRGGQHHAERGEQDGEDACSLTLTWGCRDSAETPVPTAWPTLDLPSAAARLLQTVATSQPRHGRGELKPIVEAEAHGKGRAALATVHVLGHQVVNDHELDIDLPDGAGLAVRAVLRSTGHVSMLTLMAEALKALGR